jgi:chromosome segregation ATPase
MTRAYKATPRNGGAKVAAEPELNPLEALEKALHDSRAETMRAQRDLESARLEMAEQKRRSGQQAMVTSEALKEARTERERLRMQLDALRGQMSMADRKRDGPALEEALELRARLAAAEEAERALEAKLAAAEAALAATRKELEARSAPPPAMAPVVAAQEPPRSGIFGKLFGRR